MKFILLILMVCLSAFAQPSNFNDWANNYPTLISTFGSTNIQSIRTTNGVNITVNHTLTNVPGQVIVPGSVNSNALDAASLALIGSTSQFPSLTNGYQLASGLGNLAYSNSNDYIKSNSLPGLTNNLTYTSQLLDATNKLQTALNTATNTSQVASTALLLDATNKLQTALGVTTIHIAGSHTGISSASEQACYPNGLSVASTGVATGITNFVLFPYKNCYLTNLVTHVVGQTWLLTTNVITKIYLNGANTLRLAVTNSPASVGGAATTNSGTMSFIPPAGNTNTWAITTQLSATGVAPGIDWTVDLVCTNNIGQ